MPSATVRTHTRILGTLHNSRDILLPIAAVSLIFVMLVRLPTGIMDVLLAGNLALAVVVLLTTIYVSSPLELSVFPSLLLGATLFRLVLNCATTRLILTAGERSGEATAAAARAPRPAEGAPGGGASQT